MGATFVSFLQTLLLILLIENASLKKPCLVLLIKVMLYVREHGREGGVVIQ